jgi:hypothetical protein
MGPEKKNLCILLTVVSMLAHFRVLENFRFFVTNGMCWTERLKLLNVIVKGGYGTVK